MPQYQVVLLGDSFWTTGPTRRRHRTPPTACAAFSAGNGLWNLLARDGAVMRDVPRQLEQVSRRPATAVLSIGGNDLTAHIDLLTRPAPGGAATVFKELLTISEELGSRYESVACAVAERFDRTILCTNLRSAAGATATGPTRSRAPGRNERSDHSNGNEAGAGSSRASRRLHTAIGLRASDRAVRRWCIQDRGGHCCSPPP